MLWYSHLLKNFPQFVVIHTVKGFSVVNEAEVDVFLEFSSFFYDPTDVGNLISGSSAFSKSSWNIWKFLVHILVKTSLENTGVCVCVCVCVFFFLTIFFKNNIFLTTKALKVGRIRLTPRIISHHLSVSIMLFFLLRFSRCIGVNHSKKTQINNM